MKRLTKNGWNALGVYNSHDLCKRGPAGIFVSYIPSQTWGVYMAARWRVIRPGHQTDPGGRWDDGYNKTFTVPDRKRKEAKRLEAIAWASERYQISGEWERDPWGDWHPRGTLEAAAESAKGSVETCARAT